MERIDIRVTKQEKNALLALAKTQGMTLTEYIKYKMLSNNLEYSNDEYILHCPSGERYNYAIAGLQMANYLLLEALLIKAYGDNAESIQIQSIEKSKKKLEDLYGYTKTKVKRDE